MLNLALITFGKLFSKTIQTFNLGNGSTWPGHIALKANKNFVRDVLVQSNLKTILIAGTNGKTTTTALIRKGLEENGKTVIQNESGANLLNGVASTLLLHADITGKLKQDVAIFEVDENALPHVLRQMSPDYLLLLNLFRDQLDRYGEVNTIAENWKKSIKKLDKKTTLILNADDPLVASLGIYSSSDPALAEGESRSNSSRQARTINYFGLNSSQFSTDKIHHAADSVYCPTCGKKLTFKAIAYSHLGDWHCEHCGFKRPLVENQKFTIYPLPGLYNKYNVLAALTVLKHIGLTEEQVEDAFVDFKPAFGRQEIVEYKERKVQLFLSKNPTSFNQSYTTIKNLGASTLLLVLNDRIPDGKDVSWIWDTDIEEHIHDFKHIVISGDRAYDMALRIKYACSSKFQISNFKFRIEEDLKKAIDYAIDKTAEDETLFILPTYSAMLECRKILTGKKIL
jgi:lipid II isoglutaminyl synthase (glutamine-hydrolysing)